MCRPRRKPGRLFQGGNEGFHLFVDLPEDLEHVIGIDIQLGKGRYLLALLLAAGRFRGFSFHKARQLLPYDEQVTQVGQSEVAGFENVLVLDRRCPPWRAKRRRVVPGSREATRDTRRAEGAKGDPKGASERGVQSYGRPVCSRNELAMLWRNAG